MLVDAVPVAVEVSVGGATTLIVTSLAEPLNSTTPSSWAIDCERRPLLAWPATSTMPTLVFENAAPPWALVTETSDAPMAAWP